MISSLHRFLYLLAAAPLLHTAQSAEPPFPIDPLWQSPAFVRAYTGSYGIDSRIEPTINDDETYYLTEAAKLMAKNDRKGAIDKLLGSGFSDTSAAMLFSLGNFYFEEDKTEDAKKRFVKAIELFPNFRDAHRNLAIINIREQDYQEAAKSLLRAIELGSQEGITFGLLAYCHSINDSHQAALSAYRMAQVTMPEEAQWRRGEASALQAIGQTDEAASIYKDLLKDNPNDGQLWVQLAQSYMQKKELRQAIAHMEVANRIDQLTPSNQFTLGQLYLSEELPQSAIEQFKAAVADPKHIPLNRVARAINDLANRSHWQQVLDFGTYCRDKYNESFQKEDSDTENSQFERAIALAELKTGETQAGADRVESLLDRDPTDADALLLLADFQIKNNKIEEAILLYDQAAAFPDHKAKALRKHGQLLVTQFRYKEAIDKLEQSQELDPMRTIENYIRAVKDLQ